jgi:tetratricopeptide (TPR) repeat protein
MSSLGRADPARSQPVVWPVLSGQIPPLTDSSVARQETGPSLTAGLPPGQTTVLIPHDELAGRGLGGTGKTQLAAAMAHQHRERRMADLVVWISATGRDAVLGGYAQALRDVGVPDPGPAEQAAAHFLDWLAGTTQPWLVVLDSLRDPAALDGCWPAGAAGRVLVTTELPDTAAAAPGARAVPIGPFSPREALGYLSVTLRTDPDQRIGAVDLAGDLGCVPVALGQAAAWMAETGMGCRDYRARWTERRQHPALASAGGAVPAMAAAWSLSVELADQLPPAGCAGRALALLSVLAPCGVPGAVLTSQAACAYVTGQPEGLGAGENEVRAAVHNLARAGLVTVDTTSAARTVLVHPTVQAFTRQSMSTAEASQAARAAADGLGQIWLRHDLTAEIAQPLRNCTAVLREASGSLLWRPECHPVLIEAGRSLDSSGLPGPAVDYWQALLSTSRRVLGEEHAQTVLFRDLLGTAYQASGRVDDAIGLYEASLTKREHDLGAAHPETVVARQRLAGAYLAGDQAPGAIRLAERALAETEQAAGPTHPDSLAARENLARCYLSAGHVSEALATFRQALAAREQTQGPRHLGTVSARGELAGACLEAGQLKEGMAAAKRTLEDREQLQGPSHPDTIAARTTLARAYRSANKRKEALRLFERIVADSEQVRGPNHPDTIAARADLAAAYEAMRKHANAIAQYERTFTDAQRVFGPDHPFTLAAHENLTAAASYAQSVLGIDLRTQPGRP